MSAIPIATQAPSSRSLPARLTRGRVPIAALAVLGGLLAAVGASAPWLTFFGGLVPVTGTEGLLGRLGVAGGAVTAALGLVYGLSEVRAVRWLLAVVAIALLAVAGWAAVNLALALPALQADPLTVAQPGPGIALFVVGAVLSFGSLFVAPSSREASLPAGGSLRSALDAHGARLVALTLAFAGVAHLSVGPEHLAESSIVGSAMIAAGIAQLALAALVARGRVSSTVLLPVVALNAALVVGWVLAVTVGLPTDVHGHGETATAAHGAAGHVESITALGVATAAAELVALPVAWLLRRPATPRG